MQEQLEPIWGKYRNDKYGYIYVPGLINASAYTHRDMIGRLILDLIIKKQPRRA